MHVVTVNERALTTIGDEARASADGRETGGILLGHDGAQGLCVSVAGGPGPRAQRYTNRFLRDLAHAEALADRAYEDDGSVWIGEWHTHPKGLPEPSSFDLTTYFTHLADDTLGFERFLALIVLPCVTHAWQHVSVVAWIMEADTVELADIRTEAAT